MLSYIFWKTFKTQFKKKRINALTNMTLWWLVHGIEFLKYLSSLPPSQITLQNLWLSPIHTHQFIQCQSPNCGPVWDWLAIESYSAFQHTMSFLWTRQNIQHVLISFLYVCVCMEMSLRALRPRKRSSLTTNCEWPWEVAEYQGDTCETSGRQLQSRLQK